MKQFFTVAGALYVCFSILCAYSYRGQSASVVADGQDQGAVVVAPDGSHLVGSPMVRGKDSKLVVYTTPSCYGCKTFKRDQVPKLISAGLLVEVIDANISPPEDKSITSYPTIILYDGDKEIGRWVGDTPAETILAFVPEETPPPEYRIWDIRRWLN